MYKVNKLLKILLSFPKPRQTLCTVHMIQKLLLLLSCFLVARVMNTLNFEVDPAQCVFIQEDSGDKQEAGERGKSLRSGNYRCPDLKMGPHWHLASL